MNSRNVGALVVLDAQKRPVGIVTDRDLAIRVVGKGLDPNTTALGLVMSELPETVGENTSIESAISIMRRGPYRRLPVVDDRDQLVGIVSLDDIFVLLSEEFAEIGKLVGRESPNAFALSPSSQSN
ncbi:MAG: CBS domain-containing protein [Pirellulaceae bacterium]|nr:CBS domain-containing protein [Pirellulaceae bacterium]